MQKTISVRHQKKIFSRRHKGAEMEENEIGKVMTDSDKSSGT
jgi:hypothetical protein